MNDADKAEFRQIFRREMGKMSTDAVAQLADYAMHVITHMGTDIPDTHRRDFEDVVYAAIDVLPDAAMECILMMLAQLSR